MVCLLFSDINTYFNKHVLYCIRIACMIHLLHLLLRPPLQQVKALNGELSAATDALDSKSSDLITLQRTSGNTSRRLQREIDELQAALEEVKAGEEAARRQAAAAEEQLAGFTDREARVRANAAEKETALADQLHSALAQAERYHNLAANDQMKREEVGRG